ncbi:MAG: glycine zipper 2TM domain-containing protein [Burkholderiales bacterium]|nr:glycine zipper 2TM domain-containing protein [Burkholderiales bacterium]
MNFYQKLFIALFALLPMSLVSGTAAAQQSVYANAAPRIGGFDVKQVRKLGTGTELNFTLYGTPGGIAIISIPGATSRLLLEEREVGFYEGIYTIKTADRIANNSQATANLRIGNQVATMLLDEYLVVSATKPSAAGGKTRIDRFEVAPNQLVPGSDLGFTVYGTPGARASIRIDGVKGRTFLDETQAGVYEGYYTIKSGDRIVTDSKVTANLRLGDSRTNAVLGKPLLSTAPKRRAARYCANCGVVEAVNVIEVKGDGSYLGMIAGGLAGALLGHQVGGGSGKQIATVAGAAGGAYAGNEVEKRMKTAKHYEVITRLESGGTQATPFETDPGFRVGDKVKVENNTLVRNP